MVDHLVTWLPAYLDSLGLPPLGPSLSVADDPVAAWHQHTDAVQAMLDDPERSGVIVDHPHMGTQSLGGLVAMIYTGDVFQHTWDLARASGQDDTLDPETCAAMLAGMEQMDAVLRESGQYGPRVAVPADADVQTRLIGFIGRDPQWRPGGPPTHS